MKRFKQWLAAATVAAGLFGQVIVAPAAMPATVVPVTAPPANVAAVVAPIPVPRDKTIVIDPGHGGTDVGAVHKAANGEVTITEKDANLAIAQGLAEMLRQDGYDVHVTRTDGGTPVPGSKAGDLQARVDKANEVEADLLISVHNNGLDNKSTRGTEMWYCADRGFAAENERLATEVQNAVVHNLRQAGYDTVDRGIKDDARMGHFAVNGPNLARPSQMPSITGETLFLTNDEDAAALQRPEIQQAIARGYFEGARAYFGHA